ncbi:MAG: HTTM domain-containing protein [Candidatus Binatia bacterium]
MIDPGSWAAPRLASYGAVLRRPVDAASAAAFRILFGLVLLGGITRFLSEGWVEILYVEPQVFFKYWGFSWVQVWPQWGMYAHYAVLFALALAITLGYRTRLAAALFFLGFTYVELMDVTNYLNHYYLVSIVSLLIVFLPLDRVWSLEARRRPTLAPPAIPVWVLYILRLQVGIVYVNAGLAKLGSDWLLHAQPLGIWLGARTETPLIGPWLDMPWVPYVLSWAGFLYDCTIVFALSWRRTRIVAYGFVLCFHFMTHVFFDIGIFPFLMTGLTTIFFEPDWPRRLLRLLRVESPRAMQYEPLAPLGRIATRLGIAACAVFFAVQILMPLRHWLYPGDVLWNEQGMRWAWKVMVREKNGSITYHVRERETGRTWQVSPTRYLTWRQAKEMAGQPDLILQLAHHIAADLRDRGLHDPEVRVEAWVSLNGRPAALMIDPAVDLTRVSDGLAPARWILPAPVEPPLAVDNAQRRAAAGRAATDVRSMLSRVLGWESAHSPGPVSAGRSGPPSTYQ